MFKLLLRRDAFVGGGSFFRSNVERSSMILFWRRMRPSSSASGRGGNRDINVDGQKAVDTLEHRVAAIHAAGGGAGAHGDDPLRVGHLVVDALGRERHLVGDRAGDNEQVALAREKRITSAPNRAMSDRAQEAAMSSIAQQARPMGMGQSEFFRIQF